MSIPYDHEHDNEIIPFAETNFRNQRRKFGIKTDDRRRHAYIIGKTGMGKTTLLENMIISDIRAGHGVGLVDPHGDFADKILDYVPSYRVNDVVYFNPADVEYPIAFNILETVNETHKHLVASGLMGVFKKIWPDVWSARMEYIMNNTILALLDYPGSTLLGINRMLADTAFRKKVIMKISDPIIKAFWVNEFARYNEKYATEAIAPIQNKVGQFLSASIIRNIVGQVKSTINAREIMDSGKIFIMNLSKGRIGEDNSRLLGGMLITKLQLAAMERVDIPEIERKDFYLYVDEFQNFATESFANILSEARKYRLALILAHQYIEQLDEKVAAAVFGNVGTLISFRVGAADAEMLEKEFTPRFTQEDLVNLTKFDVYLRLMIDGVASEPFSATGLPPISGAEHHREKIINASRERYAIARSVIEDKISRWTFSSDDTAGESGITIQAKVPKDVVKTIKPSEAQPHVIVPPEAPALSLSQALAMGPQSFGGRPIARPQQRSSSPAPRPLREQRALMPAPTVHSPVGEARQPMSLAALIQANEQQRNKPSMPQRSFSSAKPASSQIVPRPVNDNSDRPQLSASLSGFEGQKKKRRRRHKKSGEQGNDQMVSQRDTTTSLSGGDRRPAPTVQRNDSDSFFAVDRSQRELSPSRSNETPRQAPRPVVQQSIQQPTHPVNPQSVSTPLPPPAQPTPPPVSQPPVQQPRPPVLPSPPKPKPLQPGKAVRF